VPEVRLVDLEIIKRYSLAVRREAAPAEELLAALEASKAAVEAAMGRKSSRARRAKTAATAAKARPAAAHLADLDGMEGVDEDVDGFRLEGVERVDHLAALDGEADGGRGAS
jgi:hypothetical protein